MLKAGTRASFRAAIAVVVASTALGSTAHAQDAAQSSGIDAAIAAPAYEGFYLRADVGLGQWDGEFGQQDLANNGGSFVDSSFDRNAVIIGGIGWQAGNGLRFDVTGEYRAGAGIDARDNLSIQLDDPPGDLQANTAYAADIKSYVGMLNAYWDIARLDSVTPYIGAGIGFAHSEVYDVTTASTATFTDEVTREQTKFGATGFSEPASRTKLAWSLMAGASIDLDADTKLDLGYRYLNLDAGSAFPATSGLLVCNCGAIGSPLTIDGLDAHEFRIGLRWQLDDALASNRQPAQ